MKTIYINKLDYLDDEISLCLGYFDGLHLGHQQLINCSKTSQYKSALLTFEFETKVNFKRNKFLTSLNDKQELLTKFDIDYFLILNFNEKIMNMSGEEFIGYLKQKLNIKEIIVGEDFSFGKNASSDISLLKQYFDVKVISDYKINNIRVSSTLIVDLLNDGKVNQVKEYLGRYYNLKSKVIHGLENGHKIGFPTANMEIKNYILPKNGVYLVNVYFDNQKYYGFANVGFHPTIFKLDYPLIETHIFDFNQNIYDKEINVEFVDFIRDETKFNNLKELKNQLLIDKGICLKSIPFQN